MTWNKQETNELIRALLTLKTPGEMQLFLSDILTTGEIEDFSKRLKTARLLTEGVPYPAIQKTTGFSTTTIARVSKWLQEGKGGYRLVLSRLHHAHPTSHPGERGLR